MRMADRLDELLTECIDRFYGEIPVAHCLRLAHSIDPNFKYEPTEQYRFTLTFSDGSDITLDD